MGKVSRWTCAVILLCLCRVGLCQHFAGENFSDGFRNAPSKLNVRNFYGSKLVQRIADTHNNAPQFEQYQYEQLAQPPPPPLPPPPSRGMIPYDFQDQRIQIQPLAPPPGVSVRPAPPHLMGPPQAINQADVYTETITSSRPCPECEAAAAAAAGGQDYPYQDERDSYVEERCPCEGGCLCEGGCPCEDSYVKEKHPCPCGKRCPFYKGADSEYQPEREYDDSNYDDYPTQGDCPCGCTGNQGCSCRYSEELPQDPRGREPPGYRNYPPMNQMNERFIETQPEPQMQRRGESYVPVMDQPPYQPPPPPRGISQPSYNQYPPMQYEDVPDQSQYVNMQGRMMTPVQRGFPPNSDCPEAIHQSGQEEMPPIREVHERVIQRTHMTEVAERPVQQIPEPLPPQLMAPPRQNVQENLYTETVTSNCPCPSCQTCAECQAAGHMTDRGMQRIPVQNYQEPRVSGWRRRMPPPRHMMEEGDELDQEVGPPIPTFRSYKPILNRRERKYRQPARPPFFDGLSYSDGC